MKRAFAIVLLVLLTLAAAVAALNFRDEESIDASLAPPPTTPEQITRGAYLAQAGNCMGCHTTRGGVPYAGGRGIETPFGTVYTSNLTPEPVTGIGRWSPAHFWRALHNGRSRDGRLLYPAFPYTNYTLLKREDSDAIYAYLRSLPPVVQANRAHGLRFPFNTQPALAVWRALYFTPGASVNDAKQSPEWNRGAYLVQGLGHCNACHGSRNALGATSGTLDLGGGLIPMQNWYAPSLSDPHEAGVAGWQTQQIVDLLKNGITHGASVLGPMAEVVSGSTQHLSDTDLRAMAAYLKALAPTQSESAQTASPSSDLISSRGAKLYELHCVSCHGDKGEGVPGAYPALAGNRAVTMKSPANLVRIVLEGGFAPSTAGNPRPYGMPPFATLLNNDDTAALLSFVRAAWGNQGSPVSVLEVDRYRGTAK